MSLELTDGPCMLHGAINCADCFWSDFCDEPEQYNDAEGPDFTSDDEEEELTA